MATLSQIIAVDSTVKARAEKALTESYHILQKAEPLTGISRSYRPKTDGDETLPPESKRVQTTVGDAIKKVSVALVELMDVTAQKDFANCSARADIEVGGSVLLVNVPATYLLFLEKKLVDIHTFVQKLPTLDPAESWSFSEAQNCYASEPAETTRTKKIPRNHVKAEATDKHPAQVEIYYEDNIVGLWKTTKFSGAVPASKVAEMLGRVETLQKAVKFAREKANSSDAPRQQVGGNLLAYIFGV